MYPSDLNLLPPKKQDPCKWAPKILIFTVGVECGENRGRTRGNRGRTKEPGENRGHLGREPGENRGLVVCIYKEYRGRSRGFGTRTGGEPGREFSLKQETQLGT